MSGSVVGTYSPDKVNVVLGGYPLTGFSKETFINIEPLGEGTESESGADGEVARAISSDHRYRVTMTFQQTSGSNDIMTGLLTLDRRSGAGIVPLVITDLSGRTLFAASQAWVTNMAGAAMARTLQDREWVVDTGRPSTYLLGGNG